MLETNYGLQKYMQQQKCSNLNKLDSFSSPGQRPCELLPSCLSVVCRRRLVNFSHFNLLLRNQSQFRPNFVGMVLAWPPFKIVFDSYALHPRWPPLLKIESSSNGQNCSILSQNVPKFELCKHNDELFSIYYRIFYEL